ncbi:MAG: NosD domain-containing protein [Candidatus Bathyarchaeia archaeon]
MGKEMKRIVSAVVLALLLISMLIMAFEIKHAKAEWTGTIYIRADGSIDPPDAPLETIDKMTYTLTNDIISSGDGIIIERDNIILDGGWRFISGVKVIESKGIDLSGRENVTVKHLHIANFHYGIFLWSSINNLVVECFIENTGAGIYIAYSSNNIIDFCDLAKNHVAIEFVYSSGNSISSNNLISNRYGVILSAGCCDNTLRKNMVTNSEEGILLDDSSNNNLFLENNVTNCRFGVIIEGCNGNIIDKNAIINCNDGVRLDSSNENLIIENTIANISDRIGIALLGSSNNTIKKNAFSESGLYVHYGYLNMVSDNTINGKQLIYFVEKENTTINDAGQVVLINCSNIKIEGLKISNTCVGIQLFNTNNSIIKENIITDVGLGIWLISSFRNIIDKNNLRESGIELDGSTGNDINNNSIIKGGIFIFGAHHNFIHGNEILYSASDGIFLDRSSNNKITKNTIKRCDLNGIYLSESSNNYVCENVILDNENGASLDSSNGNIISKNIISDNTAGLLLKYYSENNVILGNNIIRNSYVGVWLIDSLYNNIIKNNITHSGWYGLRSYYSSYNQIYHNNFIDNDQQVYVKLSQNAWDNGYPSGGNYWSDYTGVDENGDNIGDTPYIIDRDNIDRYPLIKPYEWLPWSLAVVIYDWDGAGAALKGGDTWVELIRHGEVSGVTQHIDDYSRAVFYDVEPGTYYVNVWHKPPESGGLMEFWAQKTNIVVEEGKTTTVDVMRHYPVITGFEVQQAPAKTGEPATITVKIKNIDSVDQWVKTGLIVKHESGEWVYQNESQSRKLQPEQETTFTFNDFKPEKEGAYYGLAICKIVGGGEQATDIEGWTHLFTIGLPQPPKAYSLTIPYQAQDSSKWCGPTSLAMVLRYYGYMVHSWDIAEALGLSNNEGVDLGPGNPFHKNLYDYVKDHHQELNVRLGKYSYKTEQILEDIRGNLTIGYPVIMALKLVNNGLEVYHAAVAVGYNETGFFINDPGDAVLLWTGRLQSSPIQFYITNEELYEALYVPTQPNTGTLLIVEGQPPPEYEFTATLSLTRRVVVLGGTKIIEVSDIYMLDTQSQAYCYLDLDKGLTWKTSDQNNKIDNNEILCVDIHVSNHLPVAQNLTAKLIIWGEDQKIYYSDEKEILNIKPLWFEWKFEDYLWKNLSLKEYLTKTQKYKIYVLLVNATNFVIDEIETPWFDYSANYNYQINIQNLSFTVIINSNSTISNFNFSQTDKKLTFIVEGNENVAGYCNITIPLDLLGGPYTIAIDGTVIMENYDAPTNGTHAFIYFTYTHSQHLIEITGTTAIPEFPSTLILPLLIIVSTLVVIFTKRKYPRTEI